MYTTEKKGFCVHPRRQNTSKNPPLAHALDLDGNERSPRRAAGNSQACSRTAEMRGSNLRSYDFERAGTPPSEACRPRADPLADEEQTLKKHNVFVLSLYQSRPPPVCYDKKPYYKYSASDLHLKAPTNGFVSLTKQACRLCRCPFRPFGSRARQRIEPRRVVSPRLRARRAGNAEPELRYPRLELDKYRYNPPFLLSSDKSNLSHLTANWFPPACVSLKRPKTEALPDTQTARRTDETSKTKQDKTAPLVLAS